VVTEPGSTEVNRGGDNYQTIGSYLYQKIGVSRENGRSTTVRGLGSADLILVTSGWNQEESGSDFGSLIRSGGRLWLDEGERTGTLPALRMRREGRNFRAKGERPTKRKLPRNRDLSIRCVRGGKKAIREGREMEGAEVV